MNDMNPAAPINQNDDLYPFVSWKEFKQKKLYLPESDPGTLPKLDCGIEGEIASEGIPRREPSYRFYVIVQPVGSRAFQPSSWETESPTANKNLGHTYESASVYLQLRQMLKLFAKTVQPVGNRAFQPSSWEAESPTATVDLYHLDKSVALDEISAQLDAVVRWREDWDGEVHEEKPSEEAIDRATRLADELLGTVTLADRPCHTPVVTYDYDGYITLVWRNGKHELYLDITEDEIEYTKVWGSNIDSEMDSGVPSRDNYLTLWEWLLNG